MVDTSNPRVAVIGAGPYGVSIAAHLQSYGIEFRIFGTPMHRWRAQMPVGMYLKSEPLASNLADASGHYTLQEFCTESGVPYGSPVSLETFTRYALSFQRRFAPAVEDVLVTTLDKRNNTFELRLASGEQVRTTSVVLATGLSHAAYIPPELVNLPAELLSHSGEHHDLSRFKGCDVVVIGGGQSALETAGLLNEVQATVRLLVRAASIEWPSPPTRERRSLWHQLRRPASPLGDGLQLYFFSKFPRLFYHLPQQIRTNRVRRILGPAGAWWLRERVVGHLPILLNHSVRRAEARRGKALLHVHGPDGKLHELTADHVIAATGYHYAVQSLPFLKRLSSHLRCAQNAPWLSPNFESSIPGLYFSGLASAYQFGPMMRFLCGAQYTAQRISAHIATGECLDCSPLPVLATHAFN